MPSANLPVDRLALSQVFKDPRTLKAFEQVLSMTLGSSGFPSLGNMVQALNSADAASKGVALGDFYLNGDIVQMRTV